MVEYSGTYICAHKTRQYQLPDMLRVFFGQHKCASTWLVLLIERMCNELGWTCTVAYRARIDAHGGLRQLIENEKPDFLLIPEADVGQVAEIPVPFQGFHVSRDPRDIVVSGYFSHLKVHALADDPARGVTAQHRRMLEELPQSEGLDLEIATIARVPLQHLHEWNYDDPRILESRFEVLTASPFEELARILSFMDMLAPRNKVLFGLRCYINRLLKHFGMGSLRMRTERYSPAQLTKTLNDLSFTNLKQGKHRRLNQDGGHWRSGKAGDWKEHLTAAQVEEIERLFPGLIARLTVHPKETRASHQLVQQ